MLTPAARARRRTVARADPLRSAYPSAVSASVQVALAGTTDRSRASSRVPR